MFAIILTIYVYTILKDILNYMDKQRENVWIVTSEITLSLKYNKYIYICNVNFHFKLKYK